MSRKAKMPILMPKGVDMSVVENTLTIKGPKGTLQLELLDGIVVSAAENNITVTLDTNKNIGYNFLGLFWSLISNMVIGVSEGFQKQLQMIGVGFRAAVQGNLLDLQVGFSHPTKLPIPEGLKVSIEKSTLISVNGPDKQQVGQFAAIIRAKRPPEPYKGKGIRYLNEYVRKKAGKAGKK